MALKYLNTGKLAHIYIYTDPIGWFVDQTI